MAQSKFIYADVSADELFSQSSLRLEEPLIYQDRLLLSAAATMRCEFIPSVAVEVKIHQLPKLRN